MTICIEHAQKRLFGLLGSGISHSLSPLIHNYAARKLQQEAVYVLFDSATKKFPDQQFFKAMWDFGVLGFNVTLPFKEAAAKYFGSPGLNSVNTIYRGDGTWKAKSTDAEIVSLLSSY